MQTVKPSDSLAPPEWTICEGPGPVIAAAVHAGHGVRPELAEWMSVSADARRRDEDPLTDVWTSVGDAIIRVHESRFAYDCNRSQDEAVALRAEDSFGLELWRETPPAELVEGSLARHRRFYRAVHELVERRLAEHDGVLLLDIHSYNHRREGPDAPPADPADNPDIDLGVTTLSMDRWGDMVHTMEQELAAHPINGELPDVRRNVRYPDGGHFPESLYAKYGEPLCVLTLEYKKIYMDEWTASADLGAVADIQQGLLHAVTRARRFL